jgi:DNA-binding response OmpR family regulator
MSEAYPTGEVAELRHNLRTPVNHIVGYAEMLLEDAGDDPDDGRRRPLEGTLQAARRVLQLINESLSSGRTTIAPADLRALYEALRGPQREIVEAMTPLLQVATTDQQFTADVRKILVAAERLVDAGVAGPARTPEQPAVATAAASARILVVDDNEDNREVLRRRLERQGYAVEQAADGLEALARVAAAPFDLLLLDVLMPGLDGFEVLKRLKAGDTTAHLPVIMISALDDMASIVRCIEAGAEDYLPKPFDAVLLRARIGASLEKKRLRDGEREYLAKVQAVIGAASAVESGSYRPGTLADIAQRDDALGRLARVFDGMAVQVRAREERLRDQLDALQREIAAARAAASGDAEPADSHNLTRGERFANRFDVEQVVGRGGMGTVYRVRDVDLDEEMALKVVRPEFVSDPVLVERFKDEIRLARRITHPNVVRIHDFGEFQDTYYLTMEFVQGITLRDLLDTRGRLEVTPALAIAVQLAKALAVAHRQGIIHRDIKPQNLLLDAEGALKVMDFGVARLAHGAPGRTEAGLVVGTPAYMAPEQLMAESVDARSDLYAAGVVLYECLTGRLPHAPGSLMSLIAKMLHEEPEPPIAINPALPPALSSLVLRLLAKEPEQRVQSADELSALLAAIA